MKYFVIESPYLNKEQESVQGTISHRIKSAVTCVPNIADADVIVPIGGDGTMLHAIREYRHLGKPFVGINAGTRGFLMNNIGDEQQFANMLSQQIHYQNLWLLEAHAVTDAGIVVLHGFNDIWIERQSGQTLRMYLQIDKKPVSQMIIGDGMLFSTPQGSTGYNMALRGKVILPGVPVMQVTPIAAMIDKKPLGSIILAESSEIALNLEQTKSRPGRLYVDGAQTNIANPTHLTIRKSSEHATLGFSFNENFLDRMASWRIG